MDAHSFDPALLPSDTDIEFYREHGYYVAPPVIPEDLLDAALHGVERHFSGEDDWSLPITDGFSDWRPGDPGGLRNIEFLALRNKQVRALALFPLIGAIAARLAGTHTVRLWYDQLVWKAPTAPGETEAVVGWHTDRAYWMTCTSEDLLTAWIPFHDCPAYMSPLLVIDGSHRAGGTESLRSFKNKDLQHISSSIEPDEIAARTRTLALKKGQVSFHHCRMIHGSGANNAGRPRVSLAVHLQDGSNRWRRFLNPDGVPWELINDRMARRSESGTPDYADPEVFPVIWSDGQPRSTE